MDPQNGDGTALSSPDRRTFNFMGLPKELRLCIYEHLLQPATIEMFSYDSPSVVGMANHEIAKTAFYASTFGKILTPAILRTCKAVFDEAQATLYAPKVLDLHPSIEGPRGPEDGRHMDAFRLTD